MKHAFIVPLIGGQTLGQEKAFGSRPDYLLSYDAFRGNDSHLVNYYKDVPYYLLDEGQKHPHSVDVVGTTCPCAGLSFFASHETRREDRNEWMDKTTEYVLENIQPRVFWGENSPHFAGKVGKPVVERLYKIARKNGYTMSMYRTKSLLHGVPQVRERSFYFFWKGDNVPLFNYFDKPRPSIEELICSVKDVSFQSDLTNTKTPSTDDEMYRYVLEVLEGGISHSQFCDMIDKTYNVMVYLEKKGKNYNEVGEWMTAHGYDRVAARCERMAKKLASGGNIMRRGTTIPKDYIGAFVGHFPHQLTHPTEDRYLTYRECMAIMGLPNDFELLNPKKSLNHICQNVPVSTATDMANEVKAVLEGKRDFVDATILCQYNAQKKYEILDTYETNSINEFLQ